MRPGPKKMVKCPRSSHSPEDMEQAIRAVKNKGLSLRKAAKKFNVPYSSLRCKVHGMHSKKIGGQFRLAPETELYIVELLRSLTQWRVPMRIYDLRMLVKNYLDRRNIHDRIFKDNMPSKHWVYNFIKRHKLTQRHGDNVRRNRCLMPEHFEKFFENIEKELEGIPPQNIFNFDETNFTDSPAKKKFIVVRGLRRVENIKEHSQQSLSIMFCGNAVGEFLPPMIVYKAKHLYDNWQQNGPEGAVYSVTKHGWFDSVTFTQWVFKIFLEKTKHLTGTRVLLGDNLGCHFTEDVINACRDNNIKLIPLVPNSTHLLQPLDVSVFKPLKQSWSTVVEQWRKESRRTGYIPKEVFPPLIKRVMLMINNNYDNVLISGFRSCGLHPVDKSQVLKRLPICNKDPGGIGLGSPLNEAVMEYLKEMHPKRETKTKKKIKKESGKNAAAATSVNKDEDLWTCAYCTENWSEDDNRWIQCDRCSLTYHLQCSGLNYDANAYYNINIEEMEWQCEEC